MGRKKRQRKPAIEEDTSNLPCEVIFTILSKLPVKSLLRFRCVCKPWLALISEPHFIKTHLSQAIKLSRQRVICSSYKSDCFHNVDYETCGEPEEEVLLFPIKKYRNASVLCSCNGLVLLGLKSDKMYVLWNPSTREYKRFTRPYSEICLGSLHAICYDSSVNDYKVFIIYKSEDYCHAYFVVYTWKTNSWTESREFPYGMPHGGGVTVSGVPHCVVVPRKSDNLGYLEQKHGERSGDNNNSLTPTDDDDPSKASGTSSSFYHDHYDEAMPSYYVDSSSTTLEIVYFDLDEDRFMEVSPPDWICNGNVFHLTVMRGCLSLYLRTSDLQRFDVWIMKEYGNKNSWSKLISIPCKVGSADLDFLKPVCYTKNGEVVLMDNFVIFLYDPKERKLRNLTPSNGFRYPSRMVSYVDSLVLPSYVKLTKKQQHKHKENGEKKEL